MRLTLRTMLACLDADDRLDRADAEDLSQKIQQSKYASDLAARIRRLVQHPRVGTPRLDAKGNGLDANSVAEYLDNTLAHDKIADFERNCIESDVRLAEVAACHQVLVLVLEQPAEIEPAVRERMYQLGKESSRQVSEEAPISDARAVAGGGSVRIDRPATAAATATAMPTKPAPEVPDYLRAGRRSPLWPLALAAVLAFVAVGIGLRLMGPLDRSHPMAQLLGASDTPPRDMTPTDPIIPSVDPELVAPPVVPPLVPDELPDDKKTTLLPEDPVVLPPVEPMLEEPPVPREDQPLLERPAEKSETVETIKPVDPIEPPQPPPADVGRFASEGQVLVRLTENETFARVPARASIFAGDELLVLPAYRPQLLLSNNLQLTIAGESLVIMGMTDASGVASASIDYGRVMAASVGKANVKLALRLGQVVGVATFADIDSELAVEVRNYLPPGANPQTPGNTIKVVRLFTTRGKVVWQEGLPGEEGERETIVAGQVRNYVGDGPGETVSVPMLPEWIDGKNLADIDRRAAREVESKLALDRPLELALQEMASASERRAEVRALAVRSLMCINEFEPFLAVLADEKHRPFWAAEFDTARDAIARSPETARYVEEVFIKVRGETDGANLYRMLWGFSPEDLKSGLAEELVKSLEVDQLDYRVLAFENLRRITGWTLLYIPDLPEVRRRTPVVQWRERLKAGEIAYKTPPSPIVDPKPANPTPARTIETPLDP